MEFLVQERDIDDGRVISGAKKKKKKKVAPRYCLVTGESRLSFACILFGFKLLLFYHLTSLLSKVG